MAVNDEQQSEALLAPFRVLDLTDAKGLVCGLLLADFGADVIKIEKPGGDEARRIGPFYKDITDPEKSLYWFAFNRNKRGITLNIENAQGQELFKRLVERADFVIESFPPGYMDKLGLGYPVLRQINPRLVMTSISPFGQTDPYKHYKATDIVNQAMGGQMYVCGNPDRPPVRPSFPLSALVACVHACTGTLIAHYHRELTGEGQYVDASIQQSVTWTTSESTWTWEYVRKITRRRGNLRLQVHSGVLVREVWPCKDGYVAFFVIGGANGERVMRALVDWMGEEGMSNQFLRELNWREVDFTGMTEDVLAKVQQPVGRFLMRHTMEELFNEGVKRRIYLYPVTTVKEITESPQLAARDFWVNVEHPALNTTIPYPGAPFKATEAPIRIRRRAPLIGEHNKEVYEELGFSEKALITLRERGVI